MIGLAYVILGFTFIQMLVALVNLLARQKLNHREGTFNGLVSVLIPARNEEHNIEMLLGDLQNQHYKNIEIIVFDDESTDRTAEIVQRSSALDDRIKLLHSGGLPEGWLGKNHACHSLAEIARGDYLLFLDADVRIKNDSIPNAVSFSQKHELGLLSVFPKQIMHTPGEWCIVPVMNYILLSLLPLILVMRSKNPSLVAANGQFMLFERKTYKATLPHAKMRSHRVEDIEIARYYKQQKIRIACIAGGAAITCRMYSGFRDAMNGFSKNVIMFFGNSFLLAALFWLITTFGIVPIVFALPVRIVIIYLLTFLVTRILISFISEQSILKNLFYLLPQQCFLGLIIYKAIIYQFKKQHHWKGRNISV